MCLVEIIVKNWLFRWILVFKVTPWNRLLHTGLYPRRMGSIRVPVLLKFAVDQVAHWDLSFPLPVSSNQSSILNFFLILPLLEGQAGESLET